MSGINLIDIERAKRNIQAITDTSHDALLGVLVAAYSDAVQKWCRRDFSLRSYDELYDGNGDRRLLLCQYPLQSVESVRYRPVTVLKVQNTDQATNQQARVTVTSTGLTLVRVASGVKSTQTVTYASNPTLNGLATAVTALGNGWSAQVVGDSGQGGGPGDYGRWPSQDLWVPQSFGDGVASQGALNARGTFAELKMHTYELQGYQWDVRGWLLRAIPYTDPELLHPEDLIFPVGVNNFRVQYTAGYTVIPDAVQEACAIWVALAYQQTTRDPLLMHQLTGAGTASGWNPAPADTPPQVQALLKPYRRHTVGTTQG
jgi:hypothetical protein